MFFGEVTGISAPRICKTQKDVKILHCALGFQNSKHMELLLGYPPKEQRTGPKRSGRPTCTTLMAHWTLLRFGILEYIVTDPKHFVVG